MRKLAAARRLSPRERRVLGEAWVCLLFAGLALRCLPLDRVQALWDRLGARSRGLAPALPVPVLVRLTDIAGRHHLGRVRCLQRSLALQLLLLRRGIAAELRIGVRREGECLCAHAWLEHGGRPLGERPGDPEGFLPLGRELPAPTT